MTRIGTSIARATRPCVAGALFALCAAAPAQTVQVRVLAQESLPPKWIARNGHMEGLCPDIMAAVEKLDPRLHFVGVNDSRSVPMMEVALEAGKVDALCALLDTPRRQKIGQIVGKPLYSVRHMLAAAAGDDAVVNNYHDLVQLHPLINTSRGAGYTDQLKALGLQVDDSTGDNAVNLRKTLAGHGRFTYMNELTLGWYIAAEGLSGKLRILPTVLKEEPIYFWASRKADPALVAQLDQALNKLAANGELARIYERWSHGK